MYRATKCVDAAFHPQICVVLVHRTRRAKTLLQARTNDPRPKQPGEHRQLHIFVDTFRAELNTQKQRVRDYIDGLVWSYCSLRNDTEAAESSESVAALDQRLSKCQVSAPS